MDENELRRKKEEIDKKRSEVVTRYVAKKLAEMGLHGETTIVGEKIRIRIETPDGKYIGEKKGKIDDVKTIVEDIIVKAIGGETGMEAAPPERIEGGIKIIFSCKDKPKILLIVKRLTGIVLHEASIFEVDEVCYMGFDLHYMKKADKYRPVNQKLGIMVPKIIEEIELENIKHIIDTTTGTALTRVPKMDSFTKSMAKAMGREIPKGKPYTQPVEWSEIEFITAEQELEKYGEGGEGIEIGESPDFYSILNNFRKDMYK